MTKKRTRMMTSTIMRTILWMGVICAVLTGTAAVGQVSHVIHISVDGLRGDFIESRVHEEPEKYPNFRRFVVEGATTFNARTDYTHTNTLPNHTAMLTARPVLQPEGGPITAHHGYVRNDDPKRRATLHNSGNKKLSYVPSVFDSVHDNGLSTGLFASKSKFILFEKSYNAKNGARDRTGAKNGRDKIDRYVNIGEGKPLTAYFVEDMRKNKYNYSFVHDKRPDHGHEVGWGSPEWDETVQGVDAFLGELFQLVETEPGLAGDTAIVLTADHGGYKDDHGDAEDVRNYTIPVLVWGPGVKKGADLYDLNEGTHVNPGKGRPDFNASPQPIRNGSTGNLALQMLGLQPISGTDRYFKDVNVK